MSIRRFATLAIVTAAAWASSVVPASAATGEVVAFVADLLPVTRFENPSGCTALPAGSHVIFNETDGPITVYGDPLCFVPLEPLATLEPGRSMHVTMAGSFRA
ncbi:hypothetical protein [Actinophytocola xinjiangensis]|uniref:hypothetical protein n=1 Tax=Actinophytocola xinjiangensis TaxID=485602 RepID=UPI000A056D16|nr:hypothetical protein [Actinophytocola xinjiangensis]